MALHSSVAFGQSSKLAHSQSSTALCAQCPIVSRRSLQPVSEILPAVCVFHRLASPQPPLTIGKFSLPRSQTSIHAPSFLHLLRVSHWYSYDASTYEDGVMCKRVRVRVRVHVHVRVCTRVHVRVRVCTRVRVLVLCVCVCVCTFAIKLRMRVCACLCKYLYNLAFSCACMCTMHSHYSPPHAYPNLL